MQEAACVATDWAAAASATARAARVASARVAWRDDTAGRTGSGRENFSKRDAVEERDERGRACRGRNVVAGRGDLLRGGRGREGRGPKTGASRCSNVAPRWSSYPQRGTLGTLVRARKADLVGPLGPMLAQLVARGDHLGQDLIRETLRAVGELE
jgi:hypothetical protein